MLGFNWRVPPLRGPGASAVMGEIRGMVSPSMRGGVSYARKMSQNWHRVPIGGLKTGTAVWMDINMHWNEFANSMAGVLIRIVDYLPPLMEQIAIFVETRIKERIRATLRNTPRGTGHGGGIAATGRLSTDWSHTVTEFKNKSVKAVIGTKVKYARVHEFGATLRPTTSQALTVPFPGNVGHYPPAKNLKGTGLTFIKKDIIFMKQIGSGGTLSERFGKVIPIYILKRSVNIPARPFVSYVLTTYGDQIVGLLGNHVKMAIKKHY